ncbi:MAG TPA: hypothetical protein VK889_04480 [Solirubrobacterales bacterium]|nr:hypothetical protein [Solirubrobacterales bacterium]
MRRLAACLAVLLAALAPMACGGEEGEEGTQSSAPEPKVEAEVTKPSPEVRAHNAAVRKEYRQRRAAEATTAEEREVEAEVKQTATDFYAALGEDEAVDGEAAGGEAAENPNLSAIDSASFCELMSEEAIAQTIHYAKVSSGIQQAWDCEAAVDLLVIRSKRAGGFGESQKAEVIAVNAEGERATATVRFGPKGAVTSIPMVKEDGEWKLAPAAVSPSR